MLVGFCCFVLFAAFCLGGFSDRLWFLTMMRDFGMLFIRVLLPLDDYWFVDLSVVCFGIGVVCSGYGFAFRLFGLLLLFECTAVVLRILLLWFKR